MRECFPLSVSERGLGGEVKGATMRRHRPPTLVSMWMLDVFCCALGCVTLLWLLNTRQAGDQTEAAKSALTDLERVRSDLLSARTDLKLAVTTLDSTKLRLTSEISQLPTQPAALRTE